jgi:hypothetical protein
VLALPARLLGPSAVGLTVAAAAVNAAAAGAMVMIGQRLGGRVLAAIVAVATAVLGWSLGGQVLHDPWVVHLAIVPFALLLLACVALAAGDAWMLPVAVVVASFVVQLHLTFAPAALIALVTATAVFAWQRRSAGKTALPRRGIRRPAIVALVAALVAWAPPIVDQFAGRGNLGAVARAAFGGHPTLGLRAGLRALVHATSISPVWLEPRTGIIVPDRAPDTVDVVSSTVVLGLVVTAMVWALRRRHRLVGWLTGAALVAGAAATFTTMQVPVEYRYDQFVYPRRFWWPVGVLTWVALAYAAAVFTADRVPRARRVARFGPVVAAAAMLLAFVAVWPRLGVAQDYGSAGFGPVRRLGACVSKALPHDGAWLVATEGDFAHAVVAPGVASELVYRGRTVLMADRNFPDLGAPHYPSARRRPRGTVLVVSDATAGRYRPGYTLVALWDPKRAPAPFDRYRATMLVIPVTRTAAYVSSPAGTGDEPGAAPRAAVRTGGRGCPTT